jgi:hypothetical protein
MKRLTHKTKHIQSALVDLVLFKVPELFVTIYGR